MRTGKGNQEDEYEEEEFSSKKDGTSSTDKDNTSNKDAKDNDKATAIRSKHSVTEQRRRSKINERFQILRDLVPHSDQKRDTASFLLEVIDYVQYLQEKLQKYEGSCQGWSSEPTKLMPWRNSHWRVQSFVGHPQTINNGSSLGSTFPGKFDENNVSMTPTMLTSTQKARESDPSRDINCKPIDRLPEFANEGSPLPMALQANMPPSVRGDGVLALPLQGPVSDAHTTEFSMTCETLNQQDLIIEGGTISISSVYSHGLLNNLTQALQSARVDLSHASVSVQIDLGKRANRGMTSGISIPKDHENPPSSHQEMAHLRDAGSSREDSDQAQKRLKT
ncbi:transcription factor BIM2-like [Juglans microcarpa x Juglans regia]|uniref:transcription factor BIM2-like n=1 Tax=Juglans microcarpa x Juglans regia TaxID=2249226 RepID=UPI001B7E85E8|nr:transcription factor BIM2-like [Juglans microcarpa x Juglans regia]